ncbi:MAG: DUF4949 domain-containing protein [Legionella sp.]|nr:MAG: DUF4949 domain-containing protein [Legionella sp.]
MIKSTLLTSILILTSSAVLAKEMVCPSLESIKAEGISKVKYSWGNYTGCQTSQYNTGKTWSLFIENIDAESAEEAKLVGNQILNRLTEPAIAYDDDGEILCKYTHGLDYVQVFAITKEKLCNQL